MAPVVMALSEYDESESRLLTLRAMRASEVLRIRTNAEALLRAHFDSARPRALDMLVTLSRPLGLSAQVAHEVFARTLDAAEVEARPNIALAWLLDPGVDTLRAFVSIERAIVDREAGVRALVEPRATRNVTPRSDALDEWVAAVRVRAQRCVSAIEGAHPDGASAMRAFEELAVLLDVRALDLRTVAEWLIAWSDDGPRIGLATAIEQVSIRVDLAEGWGARDLGSLHDDLVRALATQRKLARR